MAAAVAGSADEARRRPPLSLCGGADALDAALVFARAGLPVGVGAGSGRRRRRCARSAVGAFGDGRAWRRHAPPDLGAVLIRHHAGVLAGCAAVQAAAPGAPFFYVADPAAAGLPPAGPSASLFQLAAAQLAARVGLPLVAGGLRTTSHEPDWQACQQDAFASLGDDRVGRRCDRRSRSARRRHRVQPPAARHGHRDLQLERDDRRRHRRPGRDASPSTPSSRSASAATTWASATRAGT